MTPNTGLIELYRGEDPIVEFVKYYARVYGVY